MMRINKWLAVAAAVVAFAGLASSARADSPIELTASSNIKSFIQFDGAGNFSFVKTSDSHGTTPTGNSAFTITGSSGVGDSLGDLGTLGGRYSIGSITTTTGGGHTTESADVTPLSSTFGGPPFTLTIDDGAGHTLTGNIAFLSISTTSDGSVGGHVDGKGTINLTNVSYTGSQSDLLALTHLPGDIASLSFTFSNGSHDLNYLTSNFAATSFNLNIAAVPAPAGLVLAAIGAPICAAAGWLRRRKAQAQKS